MTQLEAVSTCRLTGLEMCPILEMKINELKEDIIMEKYQEQILKLAEERARQMIAPALDEYKRAVTSNAELLERNQILELKCRMLEEKLYSIFFGPEHARTKVEMW